MGVRSVALAGAALAAYDHAVKSTQPDVRLSAECGGKPLITYHARGSAQAPATNHVPWEDLARPPAPITFVAKGQGQVSITASMTFVPAEMPIKGAVVRGCLVEKVVQKMDPTNGEPTGPSLRVVELGSSVVVTIQVTVADDLPRITLEDPSAGGLEPVDPHVAGDRAGSSTSGCRDGALWWWWCFPSFPYRETFADRVAWSSQATLPAGTHTVSYQAMAATRGIFAVPPAHCFVDEQPELMGMSRAGTIVVAEDNGKLPDPAKEAAVAAYLAEQGVAVANTTQHPMPCHGERPQGAVCDVEAGKWVCFEHFEAIDCKSSPNLEGNKSLTNLQRKWVFPDATGPTSALSPTLILPALATVAFLAPFLQRLRCRHTGFSATDAHPSGADYVSASPIELETA